MRASASRASYGPQAMTGRNIGNRKRVAVGGIRYEANSFSAIECPETVFEEQFIRRGRAVLAAAPANSEFFGARSVFEAASDVEVVGLLDTYPGCGSPVPHGAYERLRNEFVSLLRDAQPVNGVLLSLHGAMATDEEDDVEADLIRAVRAIVGHEVPLIVSMDLHAAVSESTASMLDGLIGFKTCPHTDYEETGRRSAELLLDAVRGASSPAVFLEPVAMITAAEAHDTNTGPLSSHMNHAQSLVDGSSVLDVSIFAAQPWLDAERTRWTVTVTYDRAECGGQARARSIARTVATDLNADIGSFRVRKTAVGDIWQSVLAFTAGPVLVADSGDSPSAGADGHSLDCLSRLIGEGLPTVLATMTHPELSIAASHSPTGAWMNGEPLAPSVEVIAAASGRFERRYPAGPVDVGSCAVVRVHNATVVITERPAMMLDTSLFDHVGLDPANFAVVQVKSAGGFRAHWTSISDRIVIVDSLGGSSSRLTELPFHKISRSSWPFSERQTVQSGELP